MWTEVRQYTKISQTDKATGITQLSVKPDHLSDLAFDEYFSF